jgi:hypothetical protein
MYPLAFKKINKKREELVMLVKERREKTHIWVTFLAIHINEVDISHYPDSFMTKRVKGKVDQGSNDTPYLNSVQGELFFSPDLIHLVKIAAPVPKH